MDLEIVYCSKRSRTEAPSSSDTSIVPKVHRSTPPGWVGHSVGFTERMINLLDTGFKADSVILVGPETKRTRIPVHKLFLTLGSALLPVLFHQSPLKGTLILEDVELEPFKAYLRLLYGDTETEIKDPSAVFQLATRFKSADAVRVCLPKLPSTVDATIVVQALEYAHELASPIVLNEVMQYVCANAARLLETEAFLVLKFERVQEIIICDDLEAENEMQVFKYVMRWGRAEATRKGVPLVRDELRTIVEQLLFSIRFPVMEISDLIDVVVPELILDVLELNSVLLTRFEFEKQRLVGTGETTRSVIELNQSPFLPQERKYFRPPLAIEVNSTSSSVVSVVSSNASN